MAEVELHVQGTPVRLSSPDKELWPDAGIRKRDLADYYARISEHLLPHVAGRPLTLRRFPDGIDQDGFYQKRRPDGLPDHVGTATLDSSQGPLPMVCVDSAADLVALAQLAVLELHRALAPAHHADHPDVLVIDLDPPGEDRFDRVLDGARILKRAFEDDLHVTPCVMTSGSRGLHLVLGVRGQPTFDTLRSALSSAMDRLADAHPDVLTTAWKKADRGDRLFLDIARNAHGATAIAPFSPRARPGAPVAVPVRWREVSAQLEPDGTTIDNVFRRLGQVGRVWQGPAPRVGVQDLERLG